MTDEEIKAMQKEVAGKKRVASEWASRIHDLVEDRLFSDFHELPELAAGTVKACEAWKQLRTELEQAGGKS
ncbi:MAG: hypothetical protein HKM02_07055 [Pseudomonadales bacterium]|nr:hypothetical protein [Pseudomonadales bacterium]